MRGSGAETINIARVRRCDAGAEVLVSRLQQPPRHAKTQSDGVIGYLSSEADGGGGTH